MVKGPPASAEDVQIQVRSLGREDPQEVGTAVYLPGESHGQRSLVGYSPQDRKDSDMTKATERESTMLSTHGALSHPMGHTCFTFPSRFLWSQSHTF